MNADPVMLVALFFIGLALLGFWVARRKGRQ